MTNYRIEFDPGGIFTVPPITVDFSDPNQAARTVANHAIPHLTPVLTEMDRPELADCFFRTDPADPTYGEFMWLDLVGGTGARFCPARLTPVIAYCTGDRCEDCTPDEECCEATCGCCPRVDEHGHCLLAPGSEEDSKHCDQHGEGWLFDRSPQAERRYQILRKA